MWNKDRSRCKWIKEHITEECMFNAWYENQTGEPQMPEEYIVLYFCIRNYTKVNKII